jgi:2-C-methyl-D-erythritol 4-phosphate cytidylyltransferase / 2-C-methyl-D-erythritol 2,4-cyclodiphosphate synthase
MIVAAILAAGRGERFGGDKMLLTLRGKPLWRYSFDRFLQHPEVDAVGIVCAEEMRDQYAREAPQAAFVVAGGSRRQDSAAAAVRAAQDAEILLIHDGARPFVSDQVISAVIAAAREHEAAAPAVPVTDTIKQANGESYGTLDRTKLVAMQTPQGALRSRLMQAMEAAGDREFTDEMAMLEAIGIQPKLVDGEPENFKITHPADLQRAQARLGTPQVRTGIGYDIHRFSDDPTRRLYVGGVFFEGQAGLDGHSDADPLLHAAVDALLGAASLGDIGQHFPNTDPQWKDKPSLHFLRHAGNLLRQEGWRIVNLDATVIAEAPKIMKKATEIRAAIAEALEIEPSQISVKATTNEMLGAIGRGEGIAAMAIATIVEQA